MVTTCSQLGRDGGDDDDGVDDNDDGDDDDGGGDDDDDDGDDDQATVNWGLYGDTPVSARRGLEAFRITTNIPGRLQRI